MQIDHSSPSPHCRTGEGAGSPAAARNEGEGEGRCSGGDPGLTLGWGGAQRRGDVSRRRRAGMAAAVALRVKRGG